MPAITLVAARAARRGQVGDPNLGTDVRLYPLDSMGLLSFSFLSLSLLYYYYYYYSNNKRIEKGAYR